MGDPPRVSEPIAVVGSSCRFPGGATSVLKLWELLRDPRDALSRIPSSRFNATRFYNQNPDHHGTTDVDSAYLLDEDPNVFDNDFFGIHTTEAAAMDPQQRILLEVVYEALEAAGYSMHELRGSTTAVFVGQMTDDYRDLLLRDVDSAPRYTATGTARSIMANRVSYCFDWRGPSMVVDTACSSSLVALHQAVQTLRSGESSMSIVAGVNLILGPENFILESKLHMLSPTSRCRMWDAAGDGYARADGFSALMVKTLKQALADGDHIECIIRETGVNQDGYTSGLTVPNPTSQTALIQSTYRKCGLDCRNKDDRCQYFEAHGTGTPVGDALEAQALHAAFYSADETSEHSGHPLLVGSVKTVIGHSEGSAGLAAFLKALVAVRFGEILPNMHFNQMNPEIQPFSPKLEVPTKLQPWPDRPQDVPRRASINSFGFGGTNAHAIIESWEPKPAADSQDRNLNDVSSPPCGPFVLSAHSEHALLRAVATLSEKLKSAPTINLLDLSWTLQCRRTHLSFRTSFSASDRIDLIEKLDSALMKAESTHQKFSTMVKPTPEGRPVRIFGVFTGQGSQWPTMGADLFAQSACFRSSIKRLESAFGAIPDGPTWSLTEELTAPKDQSRTQSAELSQPLTTALQIALVDLLKASGVTFSTVVGHSSGEIAAAYAAGYLEATDAILIAYYRGLHSHLMQGKRGSSGSMMAVGISMEQAEIFCQMEPFQGRLTVAASNSPFGVTLSGDSDAISQAKAVMDEAQKFTRILKVDRAYHSHHVTPCVTPYLSSIQRSGARIKQPSGTTCTWVSTVYATIDRQIIRPGALSDNYWTENLERPVLFNHAMYRAIQDEAVDCIIEIGPHSTLRGPIKANLQALKRPDIPYQSILERNKNGVESFAGMLGFLWENFQPTVAIPDFNKFREACEEVLRVPGVLKDLPTYNWDHGKSICQESRRSKLWRTREHQTHSLLGVPMDAIHNHEMLWRGIIKLSEMDWLRGHKIHHQVVLPAAAYISMAIDAALTLLGCEETTLVELQDLKFHHAILLEEGSHGVEIIFVIRKLKRIGHRVLMEFFCCSGNVDVSSTPVVSERVNFSGHAALTIDGEVRDVLPPRVEIKLPMSDIDTSRFYASLEPVGLHYSGAFLAKSIQRRLHLSTIRLNRIKNSEFRVHPATLDVALHGLFAAFCSPDDGRMWTQYLPTSIKSIRYSSQSVKTSQFEESDLVADCHLKSASAKRIIGDVEVFNINNGQCKLQMETIVCSSFEEPGPKDDRKLFSRIILRKQVLDGFELSDRQSIPSFDADLHDACERTAYFFLKQLRSRIQRQEIPSLKWNFQHLMSWVLDHLLPSIESGSHHRMASQWAGDSRSDILELKTRYESQIDLEIMHALGHKLPSIIRGTLPALQVLMENNMLNRLYREGLGFEQSNRHLAAIASQLSHQYPEFHILEVGGGTGSTSSVVLDAIGRNFKTYTFTDVSRGFFENVRNIFESKRDKMKYEVLDIERPPTNQGFAKHSYDLIIASNVLHATRRLSQSLENCRALLKPGGYLLLLEMTNEALRTQFTVCTLPGWWLGHGEGRIHHPTVTEAEWSTLLRGSGFSGVDHTCWDTEDETRHNFSVMIAQAVDDRISTLRNPLKKTQGKPLVDNIVILSGKTRPAIDLGLDLRNLLRPSANKIAMMTLEDLGETGLPLGSSVISLIEIEEPIFAHLTQEALRTLQLVFNNAQYCIWATTGCLFENPYANMVFGVGRSVAQECPHLRLQIVDIENPRKRSQESTILSKMFLRLVLMDRPDYSDVFWSSETEIFIKDGHALIPRLIPDEDANNRLNSERRHISRQISSSTNSVSFIRNGNSYVLEGLTQLSDDSDGSVEISTEFSSALAIIPSDSDPVYISVGSILGSRQSVLALSPVNASLIRAPRKALVEFIEEQGALTHILVSVICESLSIGITGTLWIHNADAYIAEIAVKAAEKRGVKTFFSVSCPSLNESAIQLHPYLMERDLERIVPFDTQRFINFGAEDVTGIEAYLKMCLKQHVETRNLCQEANRGFVSLRYTSHKLQEIIRQVSPHSGRHQPTPDRSYQSVKVESLQRDSQSNPLRLDLFGTLDWSSLGSVTVPVKPLSVEALLSPGVTYLLIGLTGQVGMSLCEWMVDHGAKHFALASRNPTLDQELLRHLTDKGANVRIFSLDISDEKALYEVYHQITTDMPPVAGVANGSMVLCDKPFSGFSIDEFNMALQPKVDGSRHLDQLFYTTKLDFFILFSSLSSIIGYPGQSNYGAANMFMAALAAKRRHRGVVASVIDIGMLSGLGYLERARVTRGSGIEAQMRKQNFIPINEVELHTIFTEAIHLGQSSLQDHPELITGLGYHHSASWSQAPRFWHYADKGGAVNDSRQPQSFYNIKERLAESCNSTEAYAVLQESFAKKLGLILQASWTELDRNKPMIAMGIDSLVAVEIRSWFHQEMGVDLSVLGILGGASMADLCQDAIKQYQSLPNNGSTESDSSGTVMQRSRLTERSPPPKSTYTQNSTETDQSTPGSTPTVLDDVLMENPNEPTLPLESYQRVGEVSYAQESIFFSAKYFEDTSAHNVVYVGEIRGQLDVGKLRTALYTVAEKHESLRSEYFLSEDSKRVFQGVKKEPKIFIEHRHALNQSEVEVAINAARKTILDIRSGHIMRVLFLTRFQQYTHVIFVHHHIALDGFSWVLFLRDISHAYVGDNVKPPIQQAIDMAKKQRSCLHTELQNTLASCRNMLSEGVEHLPLFPFSLVRTRECIQDKTTHTIDLQLPNSLVEGIKKLAIQLEITPFHFYLSTLAVFLAHTLGVDDIVVGIVDAGRTDVEDFETLGDFTNLIPLRFKLQRNESFEKVATRSRDIALKALANSHIPFQVILDRLSIPRSRGLQPLFQVLLNYRKGYQSSTSFGNAEIEWISGIPASTLCDLVVDITETSEHASISFTTPSGLYDINDTRLMVEWYFTAIKDLSTSPTTSVGHCPILNEVGALFGQGRSLQVDAYDTVIHCVERASTTYPHSIALKDSYGQVLSYADMMARVHQLSGDLTSRSIQKGSHVATLLTPNADTICCIISIMQCGLVWVPLDPLNPQERLSVMVRECQPQVLVCDAATKVQAKQFLGIPGGIVNLNTMGVAGKLSTVNNSYADQPAVILFTSGSTGVPKGVFLSHANIVHQILGNTDTFNIGQNIVLQQSSPGFDLFLEQVFNALTNGGTLIVAGQERGNPGQLAELIRREGVTYTHMVPSEYLQLLQYGLKTLIYCHAWQFAFAGGEKVTPHLRRAFKKLNLANLQLINVYGPTETTISCARGRVPYETEEDVESKSDSLWPLPNYSIFVVDQEMRAVPVGCPGEICISGGGVGLGYLNQPEESRSSFTDSIDLARYLPGDYPWKRFYRTGDLGRMLQDGSLNVLGRLEAGQLKIRGIRIEIGDIQQNIINASNMHVIDAAVSYRQDLDMLVAFAVFDPRFEGERVDFANQLRDRLPLPVHMRPSVIIPIDLIPLNANGKKDQRVIDKLSIPEKATQVSSIMTAAELHMKEIWQEVLLHQAARITNIEANSDFFLVGGNSLMLIKLQSVLQSSFGVNVSLPDLFLVTTLRNMTAYIESKCAKALPHFIDWDAELSTLCYGLSETRGYQAQKHFPKQLVIGLTGSTGFLGSHILQHLVNDQRVGQVCCLAIRPEDDGVSRHVSVMSNKIVEYSGDLADRFLGLTDTEFRHLTEHVDVIIHNGADVSLMKPYQAVRKANVVSTRTLGELAIPRKIPFHFISSASVAHTSATNPLPECSVSTCPPPSNTPHGYIASKWVSEALCERMTEDHGLPTWIHRPASIIGEGSSQFGWITTIIKYSKLLQAVPAMNRDKFDGFLDLVDVKDLATDIVELALHSSHTHWKPRVNFVHHCLEQKIVPSNMAGYIRGLSGDICDTIPIDDWMERARQRGLDPVMYKYLTSVMSGPEKVVFPGIRKGITSELHP